MKEKILIFFSEILAAILSIFIILYALEKGFLQWKIGLLIALINAGGLLSHIIFGTYSFKAVNKIQISTLGVIGIFFSIFILFFFEEGSYVYLAAFLYSFFHPATYYGLLAYYKEVKSIEFYSNLSWLAGLGLGVILQNLLSTKQIILFLFIFSLLFVVASIILFLKELIIEFIRSFLSDFGILPLIEKFIVEEERMLSKYLSLHFHYVEIKKPEILKMHLTHFLIFMSFGLVFAQLIPYMKSKGFENFVFIYNFVSITVSTITFRILKEDNLRKKLRTSLITRILMFLLLFLTTSITDFKILLIIFTIFWILSGISWSMFVFSSNTLILKKYEKELGVCNLFRSLGLIIGNLLSGMNFQISILAAISLLIITTLFLVEKHT